MSYSKTHDDFLAVCSQLPTQAIDTLSAIIRFIDQDGYIQCHEKRGKGKRVSVVQTLMHLTGSDKTRISKLLKLMTQSGIIVEAARFHLKFSDSLIRKKRGEFTAPSFKVPDRISEMAAMAALYFKAPRMHKGEDEMNPALKKELREIKDLLKLIVSKVILPEEVKTEVKRHLELVRE